MRDNTRGVIAFSDGVSIRPQSRRSSKKGAVSGLERPEEGGLGRGGEEGSPSEDRQHQQE